VGRPFTFGYWDDVYICKRLRFSLDLRRMTLRGWPMYLRVMTKIFRGDVDTRWSDSQGRVTVGCSWMCIDFLLFFYENDVSLQQFEELLVQNRNIS
jgi:hypothetical protein